MRSLYEAVVDEWKQDSFPQAIIIMGGPGAGKTYWMNHYAKKFFQNNIEFKKLDSDHNLAKFQREHMFQIAEDIIKGISATANSEEPSRYKTFLAVINRIQDEMNRQSDINHGTRLDISGIDYKFCKAWSDRYDRAQDSAKESVISKFQDAFFDEYFKSIFASDFSVRHMSKAEYKQDFQRKLRGEDYNIDFIGSSDVIVAITGDELKKFQDVIDVVKDTHTVQVVYLNVPIEMSIRQDAQRDRSLGETLVREIMDGVHSTWEELKSQFKEIGIYKMYEMVPADPNAKYINWKLAKTYVNTDMIKAGRV